MHLLLLEMAQIKVSFHEVRIRLWRLVRSCRPLQLRAVVCRRLGDRRVRGHDVRRSLVWVRFWQKTSTWSAR